MKQVKNLSTDQKKQLNTFRILRQQAIEEHKLRTLFWECTTRCCLNCSYCHENCNAGLEKKDMPLSAILGVLDELNARNPFKGRHVHLTGGEPLLRADLEQCGMEFYLRGCTWGLDTNGILLTPGRMYGLVDSGLKKITVKLNGLAEVQNWFWGHKHAFDKAIEAISTVQAFSLVESEVSTWVFPKNWKDLELMKKLLRELKVKKWTLYTGMYRMDSNSEGMLLEKEAYCQLLDFVKKEREKGEWDVNLSCDGFMGRYELQVRKDPFFCKAGVEKAAILIDGSITGCVCLEPEFVQGNIHTDSFVDVWNYGFRLLRNRKWTRRGICKTCDYYTWCQGNSMYLRDGKTGKLRYCPVKEYDL